MYLVGGDCIILILKTALQSPDPRARHFLYIWSWPYDSIHKAMLQSIKTNFPGPLLSSNMITLALIRQYRYDILQINSSHFHQSLKICYDGYIQTHQSLFRKCNFMEKYKIIAL